MSPNWSLNLNDLKSVARHFVLPVISGAVVAVYDKYQAGTVDKATLTTAALVAIGAAAIRLIQRWVIAIQAPKP